MTTINIHTVLDLGEKVLEDALPKALRALISEIEKALGVEVKHVSSVLTTDSGPRDVAPTPKPEPPAEPVAPVAPVAPAAPVAETPAPATPAADTTGVDPTTFSEPENLGAGSTEATGGETA